MDSAEGQGVSCHENGEIVGQGGNDRGRTWRQEIVGQGGDEKSRPGEGRLLCESILGKIISGG